MAAAVFGAGLAGAVEYAGLLTGEGVVRGVIGPKEGPRIWERHLLNCGVLSAACPPEAVVVDVGSGAGLPGIPMALARADLTVILVEPLERRVRWLDHVVRRLALSNRVRVLRSRAESAPPEMGGVVTSRAVASLDRLLPWSSRLAAPGGLVVAMKGEKAGEELESVHSSLASWKLTEAHVARFGEDLLATPTTAVVARRIEGTGGLT